MTRPPCPAPITAAAVLLIVVSGELTLAAVGSGAFAILHLGDALFPSAVAGFVLLNGLGLLLLRTALRLLSGNLYAPHQAGEYTTALGYFVGVIAVFATWLAGILFWGHAHVAMDKMVIHTATALLTWANTAGLLVAGFLLRKHTGRYREWQNVKHRLPSDAEYESD